MVPCDNLIYINKAQVENSLNTAKYSFGGRWLCGNSLINPTRYGFLCVSVEDFVQVVKRMSSDNNNANCCYSE